jgi:hypothetical protein
VRRSTAVAIVIILTVVALAGADGALLLSRRIHGTPGKTAAAFLSAWQRQDYSAMQAQVLTPVPNGFTTAYTQMRSDLRVTAATFAPQAVSDQGDHAVVPFQAKLTLRGFGAWSYQGSLNLVVHKKRWWVKWTPQAVHPQLTSGARFRRVRSWPERAPILARDGGRLSNGPDGGLAGPASLAPLLGTVGRATAADLTRLGTPYQTGDRTGHGGLQQAYERQLAGTPGGEIRLVNAAGHQVATVATFPGKDSVPLQTTLDPKAQAAGEAALAKAGDKLAALVAIQPSTGELRAIVNQPAAGFDRALLGRYPPGSTFKMITAAALLEGGLSANDQVSCPATATIGGKAFKNFENEKAGQITFATAFAMSCNTAFVQLAAQHLSARALTAAATQFGFGADLSPGVPAVHGQYPAPRDLAELAASAFGQGRVLASPLQMATVAAAVGDGTWRPPHLVSGATATTGDASGNSASSGGNGALTRATPKPLDSGMVATLRTFMRAVVTSGTAAGVHFPGEVFGKTGTAEFGTGNPPQTHAWFIGYRGDLAFAVIVEGGGVGGEVAAPIAADFLNQLG